MVLVPSIDIYQQPSMQLNIQTTEVEFTKRVDSNKSANVTIKRRPSVVFVINKVISPYLFHVVSYINAH